MKSLTIKFYAVLFVALFISINSSNGAFHTEPNPKTMKKIVTKDEASPNEVLDREIYLAGNDGFGKVLIKQKGTGDKLVIYNAPNLWLIDVASQSGKHALDGGPTYFFHDAMFSELPDFEEKVGKLRSGHELEFFMEHKAKKTGELYELKLNGFRVELVLNPKTKNPDKIAVFKGENALETIRYLEYKTDLPFEPSAFQPPKNIKFVEQ